MSKHGLKAIVATSPINVYYFSEFDCWMYRGFKEYFHNPGAPDLLMQAYAVVPFEGEPALIVKADTDGFAQNLPVKESANLQRSFGYGGRGKRTFVRARIILEEPGNYLGYRGIRTREYQRDSIAADEKGAAQCAICRLF